MNRRGFIRLSAIGAATGIIAPKDVLASTSSMAGGVYYTEDAPGRWSKKVRGHLPKITISKEKSGSVIEVVTSHGMNEYGHYIVKHILLNDQFKFLDEKMFNPMKDKIPVSEFSIRNYSGRIHVLSVCNIHDTWLNIAEV